MVYPIAEAPICSASATEAFTDGTGSGPPYSESGLFSFRISGNRPANSTAPACRKPSGAAWALQPASRASWKW